MVSTASCTCSATCDITLALFPMALVFLLVFRVSLHNREPLDEFRNGVHGCATTNQSLWWCSGPALQEPCTTVVAGGTTEDSTSAMLAQQTAGSLI
jgi:hypothetical protein